ncbi:MAG: thermonuclease family protein [Candidatus Taylorbacteria bacterium]
MINRKKAAYIAVACVLVLVCVTAFWSGKIFGSDLKFDTSRYYPVDFVVDGDTFKVNVGASDRAIADKEIITVRVLGINTPEIVDPRKPVECYGPEASIEAKELLNGRKVKLVFNPNRELKDKYGRYLAYVYRDDGLFYNEVMLKGGYAKEYTYGTAYSMQKEFRGIEAVAQKAKVGLWSACSKTNTKRSN